MSSPNEPTRTHPEATRSLDLDAEATLSGGSSHAPPIAEPMPTVPGYELLAELARGGMGVVYVARNLALGREVAIKSIRPDWSARGTIAGRFVREAQITARLPHPGVPPVHELGTLSDGRPFLAMKLIKGQTLAAILASRERERPELLTIFEQIAQTIGFAHSQGVIHRDLKPANVMIGEYGVVQVMDWGLAKEMRNAECGVRNEKQDPELASIPHSEFRTPHSDATAAGAVLGTPAFMAPEQARGEVVDCSADVFALGGILCAILTGQPPYWGMSTAEVLRRAASGDLTEAFNRLDACGADADLIQLAKQCLSVDSNDRPDDGKAVADAVAAYRTGVEQRLRDAERDRAAAEAKAAEQRKRRHVQLGLFAALTLLLAAAGAFAWWNDRQTSLRREKAAKTRAGVEAALQQATTLRKQYKFAEATQVLMLAAELATSDAPDLGPVVRQARDDLAFVRELDAIRMRKWTWIADSDGKGRFDTSAAPAAYRVAFASRGIEPTKPTPESLGDPAVPAAHFRASAISRELVVALADWALDEPEPFDRDRLLAIARLAEPGTWTDRLRDPAVRTDPARLQELARSADPATVPPAAVVELAELMNRAKLNPTEVLLRAHRAHPTDFDLLFELGMWTESRDPVSAAGYYRAARTIRPDHVAACANLGQALHRAGQREEAIRYYEEALRLAPNYATIHTNLGLALHRHGDNAGAIRCYQEALKVDPRFVPAHANLGAALLRAGDLPGAEAACREALRLAPNQPIALVNLSSVLFEKGDFAGSEWAAREAVVAEPTRAMAHYNLGVALWRQGNPHAAMPVFQQAIKLDGTDPTFRFNLGVVLGEVNAWNAAGLAFQEAARLAREARNNPMTAAALLGLGRACHRTDDLKGAEECHREAIKLDPKNADARLELGNVLSDRDDDRGAEAVYREMTQLFPNDPRGHYNLGLSLARQEKLGEAIACWEHTLRIAPKFEGAAYNLELALKKKAAQAKPKSK